MKKPSPSWLRTIAVICALILIVAVGAGVMIALQLRQPLTHLAIDPDASCPSAAASAGIEAYLGQPRRKQQAARQLVLAGRLYDDRREPPSLYERTLDHYRATSAARRISAQRMARLLCAAPLVELHGKRLAGVPSVAVEVLARDVESISDHEMFLIACGVMGAEPGARRAMIEASSPDAAISALTEICGSP